MYVSSLNGKGGGVGGGGGFSGWQQENTQIRMD